MTRLMLDGHYIFKKTPWLKWSELLYGLERGYVDEGGVIDYVCDALTIDAPNEALEIASLEPQEQYSVRNILKTLKDQDSREDLDLAEPWLFLLLSFVFENKSKYTDPLGVAEELYAEFDYPEEVAPIIRYMPLADGAEGCEELLFNNWKNILSSYETRLEACNRAP
ncbi:DUF2247 family protein [Pseudomonas sp. Z4-20]|uniref:DUF2247 family protein n=1 Tax=Pseudomonas sp. Z4-20 TaxID=2817414 RepID=UPI003DAA249B